MKLSWSAYFAAVCVYMYGRDNPKNTSVHNNTTGT